MGVKQVYLIMAFHAHELLWDLPGVLQRGIPDMRMANAIAMENYIRKRAQEARNIYRDLVAFAKEHDIKVVLDITNELLHQIRSFLPGTFEELRKAYSAGVIYPLYTHAHHTHPAFLDEDELLEEVRMNQEFLHQGLGAPEPLYRGLFFTENSVDSRFLPAVKKAGIDYVIFPHLNPKKADYTVSDENADYVCHPFLLSGGMIAFPRHFPVSQMIWRPITRLFPDKVKYQGYLMGEYYVFDEEYRQKQFLKCPIDGSEATEEYAAVLQSAVDNAPDGGLILYIQDLELMDFGDTALEILTEAIGKVKQQSEAELIFATPDDYMAKISDQRDRLPEVRFDKICWAPEIRLVSRMDGHYPPLEAGELSGTDIVPAIFRRRPFIFWEPGKCLVELFSWLLQSFGFSKLVGANALVLSDEDYQIQRFPYDKGLPLNLRFMKRACNWGWRPDEGRSKLPYLHGFLISDQLMLVIKLYPDQHPKPPREPSPKVLHGIARLPEGIIDTRIEYLTFGLKRQQDETGFDPSGAFHELDYAKDFKEKAVLSAKNAASLCASLASGAVSKELEPWYQFLFELREHCRNIFLSLDHIQRAWGKGGDVEFLVVSMYKYLYDLYPPRFPAILDEVDKISWRDIS